MSPDIGNQEDLWLLNITAEEFRQLLEGVLGKKIFFTGTS